MATTTLRTIVTEALRKAESGITPKIGEITRAETEWISEINNDIWRKEKKLRSLYVTDAIIISQGLSRYVNPSDYSSHLTLEILDGSTTGTAQGGSTSSITLESDEEITEEIAVGKEIIITSGTAVNEISQITSYSESTLIAGVDPDFNTAVVNGDGYLVIDNYRELDKKAIRLLVQETQQTQQGKPLDYYPTSNNADGEFRLRPVPDATYGLRRRYYADLLALTDTTLTALLYVKWENIYKQGVYFKRLAELDDDRDRAEEKLYYALLIELLIDETKDQGEDIMEINVDLPHQSTRL